VPLFFTSTYSNTHHSTLHDTEVVFLLPGSLPLGRIPADKSSLPTMPLHHHRSAGLAPSILVAALVLLLLVPVDAFHPRLPQRPLTSATTITSTTAASRPATTNSKTPPPSFRRSSASSPLFSGGSHTSKPPILRDPDESYLSAVELGVHKATEPAPVIFLLGIQAGLQVGLGAAMAAATWAGVPGIQASNPGLAKLIYGFCGLPCGLLLTATTVCVKGGRGRGRWDGGWE